MDREHFQRVKELFQSSLGLPVSARPEFLESACAGDSQLRGEVEELLSHAENRPADFLERPPDAEGLGEGAKPPGRDAPPAALEIPGFELRERIAFGASSLVYRAKQLRPPREVALKVLRTDSLGPGALERFEREAEILATLQHPGIAQVLGVGVAPTFPDGTPWIAMELVRGSTLDAFVATVRPPLSARLRVFVELCHALAHAHQRSIVHRDLKPSNVMVDEHGRVRVLDFGLARLVGEGSASGPHATRAGALLGTPAYMAPEQARGEHASVGPRADVYALGVMLFELVSGRLPLEVDQLELLDALRAVSEVEPARLRDGRPYISTDLDAIVAKCLEKAPERRYANAGELAEDLTNFLERRNVRARRPTLVEQSRKFILRHRTVSVAALALLATLCAGLAVALYGLRAERRQLARTSDTLDYFAQHLTRLAPRLGFGPEQRGLLESMAERIGAHLEDDPHNRSLNAALAHTLHQLASLDQSGGEYASQQANAGAALAIRERMLADDPSDVESWTHFSQLCAKLGEACRDRGSPRARDEWFARALEIDRRLVREHPGDLELLEDLGWSLERVAAVARERGDDATADALSKERLADALWIVERDSRNWKFLSNLSHAHLLSAFAAEGGGGTDRGLGRSDSESEVVLRHAQESVRLANAACDLEPQQRDLTFWLTTSCRASARLHARYGLQDEAWKLFEESLTLAEHVTAIDPSRLDHMQLLCSTARDFAAAARESGLPEEATRAVDALRRVAPLVARLGRAEWSTGMLELARELDPRLSGR
jgi:serine/threonine protein kinase